MGPNVALAGNDGGVEQAVWRMRLYLLQLQSRRVLP